jgi:hypothetical protein
VIVPRLRRRSGPIVDLIEDRTMDVEMSAQGAHRMIAEMKEEVRDFSDSFGNSTQPSGDDAGGGYCVVSVEDLYCWRNPTILPTSLFGRSLIF